MPLLAMAFDGGRRKEGREGKREGGGSPLVWGVEVSPDSEGTKCGCYSNDKVIPFVA